MTAEQRAVEASVDSLAACLGTYATTVWPSADYAGPVSGENDAMNRTWSWIVCGRGQDMAVDCPRPRPVSGLNVSATVDCSRNMPGHEPRIPPAIRDNDHSVA